MSDNLSITPTFNLYAEPQTSAGENSSIEPILIGEFTFDLEFLQENYPCVAAENSVPVVNLSTDVSSVNEGENLALNFDLNHPVPAGGLTLELDLIEGSDSFADGFEFLPEQSSNITNLEFIVDDSTGELTGAEVTLAEGATDASIVSEIVADNVTEGDESVSLGLIDGDAYDVSSASVRLYHRIDTSTGDNSSSVPVVNLSTDVSSVNEGENLALNFDLNHPVPAGGLTLELDLIEGSDSFADGFEFLPEQSSNITNLEFIVDDSTGELTGAEVTLAEGATDASIVSEIVADNVTEGDESVSLGLIDGDAYDVSGDAVSFTIIDTSTGDGSSSVPVVNLSTDVSSVNEGENLALNFDLNHPVPAGGLTLELDLIEGSDSFADGFEFLPEQSSNITNLEFIVDDSTGELTGAEVTLAEGATDASIVSEIVADNVTEGDESVSLGLIDGDDYDVSGDAVSFTIIDTSTDLNSAAIEVENVPIPFLGDVDFTFDIDYDLGISEDEFISESEIANSIDSYIASEISSGDFSELEVEDFAEFLANDSGLGIASISDSVTVELNIEPNALIPEPIVVSSTVFA